VATINQIYKMELKVMIAGFLTILIGVLLIGNIADSINDAVTVGGEGYVTDSGARRLLPAITLLFSITILVTGYTVLKKGLSEYF